MKRTVSILLAVLMLASLFSVYAAADAKMSFNISSDTALPGEEVALYVSFSNNPGVAAFNGSITYDHNALELESIDGLISGGMWDVEDAATDDSFFWSNTSNYTSNSNVMKLNFNVKSAAAPGNYTVGIYFDPDWDIVSNIDEQQIDVNIVSGAITVTSPVCTHASKTLVPAKDSTCKEQGWDKYYKCDDCGQLFAADGATPIDEVPFRALGNHTGGTATCQAKAVCTYCGNSYGSLGGHSYTAKTQSAQTVKFAGNCKDLPEYYYSCSVCGTCEYNDAHTFTAGSLKPHSFTATNTDAKYLKSAANCVSMAVYYKSCAVCGAKGTDTFSYGSIAPSNHKGYTAVVTKPTCTEGGYTTHTCSCGDSYMDSETNALGHSYDSNGKCTRCDATVPVLKLKSQVTSVEVGKEMAIRADVFNVEGVHVEWACSSLNASISVSEDTLTCTVSGNSAGTATVYARLVYDADGTDVVSDDGTTSASYGVTVKAAQENQSFFSKLISWFRDLFSKIFFFC